MGVSVARCYFEGRKCASRVGYLDLQSTEILLMNHYR